MTREGLADLLREQGIDLDPDALIAVERWRLAWAREWQAVVTLPLGDEELPAPLWCWPP